VILCEKSKSEETSSKSKVRFASGRVRNLHSSALLALPSLLDDFFILYEGLLRILFLLSHEAIRFFGCSWLFDWLFLVSPIQTKTAGSSRLLGDFDATKSFFLLSHTLNLL
jgi:hypothetical protein